MNKYISHGVLFLSLFFLVTSWSVQHLNFFEPYEYLLDVNRIAFSKKKGSFQCGVRAEYGFDFRGYPVDMKDSVLKGYNCRTTKSNCAQYIDLYESDFASFMGGQEIDFAGQYAQRGTPYGGQTASQLLAFDGQLGVSSLTLNFEYWIAKYIKIGYYAPFYRINLQTLTHVVNERQKTFESALLQDIFSVYQSAAYQVTPYSLTGFGDSECIVSWQRYFYENRDFISGIFASLRAGLYLPSPYQSCDYMDTFLKIPLGYDCAWGIPFGGALEIDINKYGGAGISADCIAFFGKIRDRFVRTDMRQTDLLTLEKVSSFVQPGFKESFSVYAVGHNLEKTVSGTLAYQYNKQNESDIFLCGGNYASLISQSSNLLENWTNHNLVFLCEGAAIYPSVEVGYSAFVKLGLTGCRSIVANTCGITINLVY
jgi:hypothetical protein